MFKQNLVYNYANPKILDFYEGEVNILDIGCGTGALAGAIKSINSRANIFGLDLFNQNINIEKVIDKFYCLDIDYDKLPNFEKKFDLIIFGDVLEHLKRPDIVLENLKEWVADSGKIIISVPNVAYFRIRLRLLFGHFDYGDTGIMDRTHLRFFTQKTIKDLIKYSGYAVEREKFVFSKKLSFIRDDSQNKFLNIFYRLFSIQFIFKIKK